MSLRMIELKSKLINQINDGKGFDHKDPLSNLRNSQILTHSETMAYT